MLATRAIPPVLPRIRKLLIASLQRRKSSTKPFLTSVKYDQPFLSTPLTSFPILALSPFWVEVVAEAVVAFQHLLSRYAAQVMDLRVWVGVEPVTELVLELKAVSEA